MKFEVVKSEKRTQAQGALTLVMPGTFSRVQIDVETSATALAGSLAVGFLTPGMTQPKALLDADGNPVLINLTKPYPVSFAEMSLNALIFTPTGFDADKTFRVAIVHSEVQ